MVPSLLRIELPAKLPLRSYALVVLSLPCRLVGTGERYRCDRSIDVCLILPIKKIISKCWRGGQHQRCRRLPGVSLFEFSPCLSCHL